MYGIRRLNEANREYLPNILSEALLHSGLPWYVVYMK